MLVTRRCSECGKEVEYKSELRVRSDLFFCSQDCANTFWERDTKRRRELGWSPLREDDELNDEAHVVETVRRFI